MLFESGMPCPDLGTSHTLNHIQQRDCKQNLYDQCISDWLVMPEDFTTMHANMCIQIRIKVHAEELQQSVLPIVHITKVPIALPTAQWRYTWFKLTYKLT